ncbi:NAD(P)/FAD-dependent oxidoreductase [Limobrevibacterium gyesilva]|uniref:FAD-binding oxidoreductase n=1 Tax=Limobrevibacterium gyesilva TaxID=2991712 RepID=A0AA42CGW8_9PROT|nr:FAD-binding oxidoreductase [Limobrevibacterium gyesilva]MCW3474260.1 FAD-binding oxidoreductase [Limobrevibacterium gyesilva]
MDTYKFDIVVIGAGIAGATAAAHLAENHRVALIEAEEAAGYHTTGRSAALWIQNYGPPDVRAMSALSRSFFETPPPGFTDTPLMSRRPVVTLAPADQEPALRQMLAEGQGMREIPLAELRAMVPALRPDYAVAATIEDDAFDMDVAALLQGFLRQLRARDGVLALRSRAGRIERRGGMWHVEVTGGAAFTAPVVVDAAGAWGDEVAALAGARPLGLVPKRRTAVIVDPAPWQVADWPMLSDAGSTWYARAEARTKLLVSPADETDTYPHDARPDELDVAIAVDRMQQALDIEVRRIEHSWAGLRTFTPDRSLAIGWDREVEGFFWSVGQGGYGIQTSPAQGRLVADLVGGRDPGAARSFLNLVDPKRFHAVSA